MSAKTAALVIGFIFIAVGLLGYVDNPIVGESENVIFHADSVHNWVHIISGVLFVLIASVAPSRARTFLIIFGIVYLAIGILGLMRIGDDEMTQVFGFLHVNSNDNYLHIGLGVLILLAGVAARRV
ncbi:MAG TPA: DUF4383 domain-containing protein [Flavisolibacter sp.]